VYFANLHCEFIWAIRHSAATLIAPYLDMVVLLRIYYYLELFKGTLTRDFGPLVFFIKQLPLGCTG
jgi:hypothetical protein